MLKTVGAIIVSFIVFSRSNRTTYLHTGACWIGTGSPINTALMTLCDLLHLRMLYALGSDVSDCEGSGGALPLYRDGIAGRSHYYDAPTLNAASITRDLDPDACLLWPRLVKG
jgi:hypothetical protein